MGQGYLIDTNAIIDFLNDKLPEKSSAFIETANVFSLPEPIVVESIRIRKNLSYKIT